MGREIELKIPLTKAEYDDVFAIMNKEKSVSEICVKTQPEFIEKSDEYYSRYTDRDERKKNGEPQVLRIRGDEKEGQLTYTFTIKRKRKENGIEFNEENETLVENPEVLRDLFMVSGYIKYFEKCKEAYGCHCNLNSCPSIDFHLELEKVNQYFYVEIECTDDAGNAEEIGQSLENFVRALGLDPAKRDSRSWMKILNS